MIATDGRIVSYNTGTRNVKYLPLKTTAHHYSGSNVVQAVDCVNSIVSVKRGNKLELGANIGLGLPI